MFPRNSEELFEIVNKLLTIWVTRNCPKVEHYPKTKRRDW